MKYTMEQQGNYSTVDLLDLSISQSDESPNGIQSNTVWRDRATNVKKGHGHGHGGTILMSKEESKIRSELEIDIERDLEEEIKDGIYHLALRLHRLYQHQRERTARETSTNGARSPGTKNALFSEMTITIKMEGGSKIEIKEIKKEVREKGRPRTSISEDKQGKMSSSAKEFDWVRTLRSGTSPPVVANKKHGTSSFPNVKNVRKEWKNCSNSSGQHKRKVYTGDKKLLELGWRS